MKSLRNKGWIFLGTGILFWFIACTANQGEDQATKTASGDMEDKGRLLAEHYCASCHSLVSPEQLPKEYWKTVLLRMSAFLGFKSTGDPFYGNTALAIHRLDSAGIFPPGPMISNEDWQKLVLYYLENAPDTLAQTPRPPVNFTLKQFKIRQLPVEAQLHGPTFVKILPEKKILLGYHFQNQTNELWITDPVGSKVQKTALPSILTQAISSQQDFYLTCMGPFIADDTPVGSILKMERISGPFPQSAKIILNNLERPVHISLADLNQDGRQDIISSEFGKFLGGLYLYLQDPFGGYQKEILYPKPGTLSTILRDVNDDQLIDIYALVSQADEGIYLFLNKGMGVFESRKILTFPPYYGSVHFELIDFDQDGMEDIIYSNGDSGDFGTPAKPFHGIRYFRNSGNFQFEEKWFYPQQGAYKTCVVDFDMDGDFDLASIGFFAGKTGYAQEGFLYLENKGSTSQGFDFEAYSFSAAAQNSYLVMDAGDIDLDGDIDLILGASAAHLNVTEMVNQLMHWQFNSGSAITILENTAR